MKFLDFMIGKNIMYICVLTSLPYMKIKKWFIATIL